MELEHSFSVPVPLERAWDVLLDVERVAPCMPGASLDSVNGDEIAGRIKVKVGPISMTYAGTAKFTERNREAGVVTLDASGKETRGAGTASASVRSELTAEGDQTHVTVHTSLNVTGKPAQFGRGVMVEVGGKLIGIFADNLAAMLAAEPAAPAPAPADAPEPAPAAADAAGAADTAGAPGGASEPEAATDEAEDEDDAEIGGNAAEPGSVGSDEALPIDVLNLPVRAWNSLRKDGIQTLGDLVRRTPEQLLAIGNIGQASLADIVSRLADRGLELSGSGANGVAGGPAATPASGSSAPSAGSSAGAAGAVRQNGAANGGRPGRTDTAPAAGADDTAGAPAPRQPVGWQPQDDAIDLLGVAGLPVLKRVVPAAAGVLALILVVFGIRRRRARRG
jgi:carbon monoxide dehydrogenase subunit G